jgi:hypothetical protein
MQTFLRFVVRACMHNGLQKRANMLHVHAHAALAAICVGAVTHELQPTPQAGQSGCMRVRVNVCMSCIPHVCRGLCRPRQA